MIDMRNFTRFLAVAALIGTATSCGDVVRNGRAPSYLVIDSLQGIRGAAITGGTPTSTLVSDVIVTSPAPCTVASPCIFGDPGQAAMHLALKDPGPAAAPTQPSLVNAITINRYHVDYVRADGRNTPGVDVPYGFDGAVTVTVSGTNPSPVGFELVRVVAKEESPLVQLKNSASFITVLANVTFYGHDQAGNEVSVTGSIQIDFGNFGDL
jgi:hypothetical protein